MELPNWALMVMWAATLVGAFMLTREMMRRFGLCLLRMDCQDNCPLN